MPRVTHVGNLTIRQHEVLCQIMLGQLTFRYENIGVRWYSKWYDPADKDVSTVVGTLLGKNYAQRKYGRSILNTTLSVSKQGFRHLTERTST